MIVLKSNTGPGLNHGVKCALICYVTQLAINACWSTIFFKWHYLGGALLWSILLGTAVIVTNWKFFSVNKFAGYVFVPYTMWCMFATVLAYSIWLLNYDNKSITE